MTGMPAWGAVIQALRAPDEFALAWDRSTRGERPASWAPVFGVFFLTAVLGTAAYGLTMGLTAGAGTMLEKSWKATVAAGGAWATALPTLYIFNSLLGSQLRLSTTFLAALVTTSFGGLAMLASIPVNWIFSVTFPGQAWLILAVNLVVFTGVGLSMSDTFLRVMRAVDPWSRVFPVVWLAILGCVGMEYFYLLGLFKF
jgi:hypothetical protein